MTKESDCRVSCAATILSLIVRCDLIKARPARSRGLEPIELSYRARCRTPKKRFQLSCGSPSRSLVCRIEPA